MHYTPVSHTLVGLVKSESESYGPIIVHNTGYVCHMMAWFSALSLLTASIGYIAKAKLVSECRSEL